jgi:anti-anti-sigma factor
MGAPLSPRRASSPMQIQEDQQGAVTVLKPVGPLTHEESQAFKDRLEKVRGVSLGRLVVDASAIPFVDSAGLEALAEASQQQSQSGQTLKLCGLNETLREVLGLTELADQFEHFEDAGAAVRSFL